MGLIFEELIHKFAEMSNETAGEHFTPREVIRLMVNLIFIEDDEVLTPGNPIVRTIYDPTAGTGGMLSVAGEYLLEHNPKARLTMYGQEFNDESYAICKADMLIKGQDVTNIVAGNTLSDDGHQAPKFDYMLSNPPFGVEWKKVAQAVKREVLPHAPDAWIDHDKTKVGYEIPFNRHFYVFEPPRALEEIDADLTACTDRIKAMIEGLTA